MVGYGNNYPRQVHHRGSSIVSIKVNPTFVSCRGGYATWFSRKGSDPNILAGAIVGGPDAYDSFADERDNYEQTEPATYNNAPLLGILARLSGGHGGFNQLLPGTLPYSFHFDQVIFGVAYLHTDHHVTGLLLQWLFLPLIPLLQSQHPNQS